MTPDSAALSRTCSPFSLPICLRIGNSFFWNSLCSSVCSSVTSACASCSKRCSRRSAARCPSRAARAPLRSSARRPAAARVWLSCSGLGRRGRLRLLLGDERLNLCRRRLAFNRQLRDRLQVHEADLRALRKRRRRRRSGTVRRRRGCWAAGWAGRGCAGAGLGWAGACANAGAALKASTSDDAIETVLSATITNSPFVKKQKRSILHQIGGRVTGASPRARKTRAAAGCPSSRTPGRRNCPAPRPVRPRWSPRWPRRWRAPAGTSCRSTCRERCR